MKSYALTACVLISVASLLVSASGVLSHQGPPANENQGALQIRLAEARLALAETELTLAEAQNQAVPGLIDPDALDQMKLAITNEKARLDLAKESPDKFTLAVLRPGLQFKVQALKARAQRLDEVATGSQMTLAINAAKMSRARLNVAQAELASLEAVVAGPVESQVHWQLEQLSSALDQLTTRVTSLENNR
jgi:hypothetical protein